MVQRLVELHGGTVHAKSEGVNHGATFTIELPAIERPASVSDADPMTVTAKPRRILIIEDDEDARDSLAELLRLDGHHVTVAGNGADGVASASASTPDFVLVDIGLHDIDGYEVARRLRTNSATSRLRLIAVTGYGTQEDRRSALAAGFDEHLAKPVALETLRTLLLEGPT